MFLFLMDNLNVLFLSQEDHYVCKCVHLRMQFMLLLRCQRSYIRHMYLKLIINLKTDKEYALILVREFDFNSYLTPSYHCESSISFHINEAICVSC